MLTKVDVNTQSGDLISIPLDDISDGLLIENIDGLDPVKATLVSSSFAQQDGAQYQSSRREARNVVLTIGLEPDYVDTTVRDLRRRLYNYLMPKSLVDLTFYDSDGTIYDITGRVETFEAPLFTQEPKMDCSIMCFDPDFVGRDAEHVDGNTTSGTTPFVVTYDGTVETGVVFQLNVNRAMSEFTIYQVRPDGTSAQLDFVASLVSGDVLTISTVPGNKYVTLTRSGSDSSLLYGMSPTSNWIELFNGDNQLRVYAEGAAVPFTIDYFNRYGGL